MKLTDVRRLTGLNFHSDKPGAIAEAVLADGEKGVAVALWRKQMRLLLDAVGWRNEDVRSRAYPGGASLMITAPVDALYVAADMIEHVFEDVKNGLDGAELPEVSKAAASFRDRIAEENAPQLHAIVAAARKRDVTLLGDDGTISLGLGKGCRSWPEKNAPAPGDIDWSEVHDVPLAMVTGTNGKSTTVRLTAAICAADGHTVGLSSSDWVRVGNEIVDEGDYSGPAGAKLAVRDTRVDLAVIETARGGLMRRGLPIPQADACLITNVAADHLGDYGITDVSSLADAKFLLARAVKPGGRLILNGDDAELVSRSVAFSGDITWYGLSLDERSLNAWLAAGGHAAFVKDANLTLARDDEQVPILPVNDFAPGMRGAAKFNISNALGAIALASALGIAPEAMTKALSAFQATPEENPGRGNFLEFGGITVLVDFAHNPHGVAALADAVKDIPAKRRLFLLGQAGDRSDEDIREMTRVVWDTSPGMIVVKELETKLRGRKPGEVPAVIIDELHALGAPDDVIMTADSEIASVHQALSWACPGDFLVLLLHVDRKRAMALLEDLRSRNWQAGDPLGG